MLTWILLAVISALVLGLAAVFGRQKYVTGKIKLQAHKMYTYEAGNCLQCSERRFMGLSVALPKSLPHMYLDHRVASKFAGPMRTYANTQRVNLEGDFDRYFQLFTPEGNEVLALSVMSPDVMQTLMRSAKTYDVEIKADRLNIIAGMYAGNLSDARIKEMTAISRLLLGEVDHKLHSWSNADAAVATATELT